VPWRLLAIACAFIDDDVKGKARGKIQEWFGNDCMSVNTVCPMFERQSPFLGGIGRIAK
jgi:hypothetical protein